MPMDRRNFVSAVGLGGLGVATTGWTATSLPSSQSTTMPTSGPSKENALNHLITDYGAIPDGKTKNHRMIQAAIDACEAQGGGTVVVPAGVFLTGTLYLKDNVELHLEAGAILRGSPDKEDYNADDFCPQNRPYTLSSAYTNVNSSGAQVASGAHLIVAVERKNVSISGPGRIDGNSSAFMVKDPEWRGAKGTHPGPPAPLVMRVTGWRPGQMLYFVECVGVSVRSMELFNSPFWTCFFHGCEEVTVHGVQIKTHFGDYTTPHGDGLDISCCRNVTISNCRIHTGDDCIALVGTNAPLKDKNRCSENIVITNCVLASRWFAIRVGLGDAPIRNCTFSNIVVREAQTAIIIIPHLWSGQSGSPVDNLRFSNWVFDVEALIGLCPFRNHMVPPPEAKDPPLIRNVHFSQMSGRAKHATVIRGLPAHRISGISFHDIDIEMSGGDNNGADHREIAAKQWRGSIKGGPLPLGVYFGDIDELSVRDVKMRWESVTGPWNYGLVVERCKELALGRTDIKMPEGAEKDVLVEE